MGAPAASGTTSNRNALIKDALSAASPLIAQTATVKDWDGTVLKQGNDDFTCFPTEASKRSKGEKEPMCLDKVWVAWGDAWMNKKPFKAEKIGIAYMLAGDTGASNIDPYAKSERAIINGSPRGRTSWFFCPIPHSWRRCRLTRAKADPMSCGRARRMRTSWCR